MRLLTLTILLASALSACMRSDPAELMETAKFEELQQNVPHAKELYERIINDHPDSPQAKEARERLGALSR